MARVDYTAGKVQIESDVMSDVTSAGLTMNGENWDITAIGDNNPSMEDVTETFQLQITANYNPSDTAQASIRGKFLGGSRTLTSVRYYQDDTNYISGSALISTATLTKSVGGFDQLNVTIDSRGTWAYA